MVQPRSQPEVSHPPSPAGLACLPWGKEHIFILGNKSHGQANELGVEGSKHVDLGDLNRAKEEGRRTREGKGKKP